MQRHDASVSSTLIAWWYIVLRRKWIVLAAVGAGVLIAAVYNHYKTPVYQGSALIMIENEAPRMVGLQDLYVIDASAGRWFETQLRLICSRTVLQSAAKRLQLRKWPEFAGTKDAVGLLATRVSAERLEGTQLAWVNYEGPDRMRVDDVVNAIVECFREDAIRRRRNSTDFAADWMDSQLPRLRSALIAAEERLYAFQAENKIVDADPRQDIIVERLKQLNIDLLATERERIAAEAEWALVKEAAADPEKIEALTCVLEKPTVRSIDTWRRNLAAKKIELLTTVAPDHREVSLLDAKLAELQAERERVIRPALAAVENRLAVARQRENTLRIALNEQHARALELNSKIIELGRLKRDVKHAKDTYEPLLARFRKVDLASGLSSAPVQIVDPAKDPGSLVSPRRARSLVLGVVAGLLVGIGAAFLAEQLDQTVRVPHDLGGETQAAMVAAIPHIRSKSLEDRAKVCAAAPTSVAAEAYRSLRTRVLMSMETNKPVTLLVTSCTDREGKTTTAANTAIAFAQIAKRVLLVDADLRRSTVHRLFAVENDGGLTSYLANGLAMEDLARKTSVDSLCVLPAGPAAQNPSELLGSKRMSEFLEWARENYDLVVLDSPPLTAVTDGLVLAPYVDGVVLVVLAGSTSRSVVTHGRELLEAAKARTVSIVLNDIRRSHAGYGYGYGYYQYYRRYAE